MTDGDALDRTAEGYRAFVTESAEESPAYSALAAAVAEDRDVLAFLAGLPPGKRHPPLFLASLRFLDDVPADGADLHELVTGDGERLRATMLSRATQTNEPARCAGLLPALATIDGPLALVEVGTSAGMCGLISHAPRISLPSWTKLLYGGWSSPMSDSLCVQPNTFS